MTKDILFEIQSSIAQGLQSFAEIAHEYGVTRQDVCVIADELADQGVETELFVDDAYDYDE